MTALGKLRRYMRGVPRDAAVRMIREACCEYLAAPIRRRSALSDPRAVADYCRVRWAEEPVEVVAALLLDSRNRVLEAVEVNRGTVDAAAAFPREFARRALLANAAALILCHNHPSGNPDPSDHDRALTREVQEGLRTVGVRLLDHVIVGREGHYSMQEHGWRDL